MRHRYSERQQNADGIVAEAASNQPRRGGDIVCRVVTLRNEHEGGCMMYEKGLHVGFHALHKIPPSLWMDKTVGPHCSRFIVRAALKRAVMEPSHQALFFSENLSLDVGKPSLFLSVSEHLAPSSLWIIRRKSPNSRIQGERRCGLLHDLRYAPRPQSRFS